MQQTQTQTGANALPVEVNPELFRSKNADPTKIHLNDFITEFGPAILESVEKSLPPVYTGEKTKSYLARQAVMDHLKRQPFSAQAETVQAAAALLLDAGERAVILNCEMGTGKTEMSICLSEILRQEGGYRRTLVLAPPHLVYKWRREILETVPGAKVVVLNGPETLAKLLGLRARLEVPDDKPEGPEFYIMGRVRLRLGFHWRPVSLPYFNRKTRERGVKCPNCFTPLTDKDGHCVDSGKFMSGNKRCRCPKCGSAMWTLIRPNTKTATDRRSMLIDSLKRIPTIGEKTAEKLIGKFGEELLAKSLGDNTMDFVNLLDENGDLYFSDKQARRMERAMANMEFGWGQGGYQPSEFIKRYLPDGFFDILIVDEGHEYKSFGSAQGQAMGVVASKCKKAILLTGTLMGGYADDLFSLLFRLLPQRMVEDGFKPKDDHGLSSVSLSFLKRYGVIKEIRSETVDTSFKTATGKKSSISTKKAPGMSPQGIFQCVLPFTVFLKLAQIDGHVLPPYTEEFLEIEMTREQRETYEHLNRVLVKALNDALAKRDKRLLGTVLNALLAWPDCAFREEEVFDPRNGKSIVKEPAVFDDDELMPKERKLVNLCKEEKAKGRRVLVYSIYTGRRDTTARLKKHLQAAGLRTEVMRSTVDPAQREDWILEKVDRGIDVLICHPDLVKTGLDLIEFPTIVYMQTGYSVFTLQQASRRSWRIGQTKPVRVVFLGYAGSTQMDCLTLMSKKIAVSQSTSGEIPESGLESLNSDGDSVEMALARRLVN
jgi:SNF2 family DNA or RNA helicase